ncbi:MAG: thioredoxin family protein [Saprospiraceae bacterium]|nr:thioredoxin family protein [Saprospiraceae bacterium]
MKYSSLLLCFFFLVTSSTFAQDQISDTKKNLYNPEEDAKMEIANAVDKAKKEGKHVLLQIGGNWCGWCIAFDNKVQSNDTLLTALQKDYVVYHLNHSLENKNEDVLKTLGYPQRFGFPVFVVLDGEGNRLHTQYSGYLEEGKGHSTKKTMTFLRNWTPSAIDPKNYDK